MAVEADGRWLLDAGDAYFFHGEMESTSRCTPGLRAYQIMMEKDRGLRLANQERLRALRRSHGAELELFCSHDAHELEQHSGRKANDPASA